MTARDSVGAGSTMYGRTAYCETRASPLAGLPALAMAGLSAGHLNALYCPPPLTVPPLTAEQVAGIWVTYASCAVEAARPEVARSLQAASVVYVLVRVGRGDNSGSGGYMVVVVVYKQSGEMR